MGMGLKLKRASSLLLLAIYETKGRKPHKPTSSYQPIWWVVYYEHCKELLFRVKNKVHALSCLCISSKSCMSQRDILFIWLRFSFLWEKNLSLTQAIPKCQYMLSIAWSTSVSIQGIDRTSSIDEYWHANMCTHTERWWKPDSIKLWINVPWKRIKWYLTQREIIMCLVSCYIRKT